jgi:hypothetical protein
METSASDRVKLEAAGAILEIGFGTPIKKANEELAVWAEADGLDIGELCKQVREKLTELKSRN